MGAGWQKSGLKLTISPKSEFFSLLDPQPKEVSTFLIIIAKLRSSQTFFVQIVFFNVFDLGSAAYWMDATRFCSLCGKPFFLANDVTMTSQVGETYLKMCRHVLQIQWYLRLLSRSFRSDVMVAHMFTGHYDGFGCYHFCLTRFGLELMIIFWNSSQISVQFWDCR